MALRRYARLTRARIVACPMHIKRLTSKMPSRDELRFGRVVTSEEGWRHRDGAADGEADEEENAARFTMSRTIADDGLSYLPLAAARAGAEIRPRGNKPLDSTTRSREVAKL